MKKNTYTSEKNFFKEKTFFITNTYILVGHRCEFEKKGDYKTIDFFEKSIAIYKFKEKISAFTNKCAHRGCKIFNKAKGNSAFVCPYHAWSYDNSGRVKNIPFEKKAFKINKNKIKLEEWALEFCGDFIFLKSKINKISLKKFLGKEFDQLLKISKNIQKCIDYQVYKWGANWQICVENSIDEYHAIFLHKTTFKNVLKLEPKYEIKNNVMKMKMPLSKNYIEKFKKIKNYFNNLNNTYMHTLFFPYSSISSTMGNSYYIQNYLPEDIHNTNVTSTIYLPKSKLKKNPVIEKFFSNTCIKFNHEIFYEDKDICESIYSNVRNDNSKKDIIGNLEFRIKSFRKKLEKI